MWYIATFYNGYDHTGARSVNNEPSYLTSTNSDTPGSEEHSGPGYGMSVSLNRRDMYLAYLSGTSIVQHEDWHAPTANVKTEIPTSGSCRRTAKQ